MRAVTLAVAVTTLACGEIGGMLSLQQQLAREFASPQVNINVTTNGSLTVTFLKRQGERKRNAGPRHHLPLERIAMNIDDTGEHQEPAGVD